MDNSLKTVVIGDGSVGKTCMLISYALNKFQKTHVPTLFDNFSVTVTAEEKQYLLCLFDTAGQEEYDRLRVLAYPGTDIFMVCFSLVDPASFDNVSKVWIPEIKHNCGEDIKFVIVGTKEDLRHDIQTMKQLKAEGKKPITKDQGEKLAKKTGALGYFECSALTENGLKNVFNEVILSVVYPKYLGKKYKSGSKKNPFHKLVCVSNCFYRE